MAKTGKDGKLYPTDRERDHRTDAAITLISNGVLDGQAKQLLSDKFQCSARTAGTYLSRARARLREHDGRPIDDVRSEALEWYRKIIRDASASVRDRIKARTRMDMILGIDAPTRHLIGAEHEAVDYTPADAVRYMDAATMGLVAEVDAKVLPESPGGNGAGGNGTGQKD